MVNLVSYRKKRAKLISLGIIARYLDVKLGLGFENFQSKPIFLELVLLTED